MTRWADCPYAGMPLPVFALLSEAALRRANRLKADAAALLTASIAASFDKDANAELRRSIDRLLRPPRH